jgi:hypothetical protein
MDKNTQRLRQKTLFLTLFNNKTTLVALNYPVSSQPYPKMSIRKKESCRGCLFQAALHCAEDIPPMRERALHCAGDIPQWGNERCTVQETFLLTRTSRNQRGEGMYVLTQCSQRITQKTQSALRPLRINFALKNLPACFASYLATPRNERDGDRLDSHLISEIS